MSNYVPLLEKGELLGELFPVEPGSQMWAHDYQVCAVEPPADAEDGNTVLFAIAAGGSIEPTAIVRPIALQIRAIRGVGEAVIYNTTNAELRVHPLTPGGPSAEIVQGDVYYYRNTGDECLILRDDCAPPFQEGDEQPLDQARELSVPASFLLRYAVNTQ